MEFFGISLPELIRIIGLVGVCFIVFAETGLFLGFFLPGDSLLFVSGVLASQHIFSLPVLLGTVVASALLGNFVGYEFGFRVGEKLFAREDSFFFKKRHAESARAFYEENGGKTIFFARFIPIVRTFAPIVAGVAKMDRRIFFLFTVIGGCVWVLSLILAGYFLGSAIDVDRYLLPIIIGIVVVSFLPVAHKYWSDRRKSATKEGL
jgi:membrane-associated protein